METVLKSINLSRMGVNILLATLATFSGLFFGQITKLHEILFIVMIMDYCSGVAAAISLKRLSSFKAHIGIMKKIGILALVALAYHLDLLMGSAVICSGVIAFFIANEFISVAENYKILGLPIPDKLSKVIEVLGDKKKMNDND